MHLGHPQAHVGATGHQLGLREAGPGGQQVGGRGAHVVQQFGDLELFLEGHGGAGALLAVAQRGVVDGEEVRHG